MNLVYIVVSLALLGLAAADAGQKTQLEQLCRSGKGAPEVTTISEVRSMIGVLRSDSSINCAPGVRNAIVALEPVVELESVCSEQAADAIVDFWAKYVDKKSALKKHLPTMLKKFFIGFGLQVNRVCKQTLVERLEQASQEKGISEQDIDIVTGAMTESDKLKVLFDGDTKLENLVVIVRTDAANDADGRPKGEKLKIKMEPKQARLFELMQERCVNKFKPIYDTLISPVVRLAAIGLNNGDLGEFHQSKVYQDWFNVVVACEPFVNLQPIVIPVTKQNAIGDAAMVTVLDEEDLAELRKRTGLTLEEPAITEPVDYKVQVQIDDVVLEPQLASSIADYGRGLKEITKLKKTTLKRLSKVAKHLYKNSNQVKISLKSFMEQRKDAKLAKFGGEEKLSNGRLLANSLLFIFAMPFDMAWYFIRGAIVFVIMLWVVLWVIVSLPFELISNYIEPKDKEYKSQAHNLLEQLKKQMAKMDAH